ncbi:MAG: nitroreductase family protein [Anaerolineae bacterium]
MEFAELINTRYSVRAYQSREIDEQILGRILEAFVLAPTAANRQAIGAVVIRTPGREQELRAVYNADWFASQPPIVICVCTIPGSSWVRRDGKNYADVDASIAMDHLVLAATNEGLGTCWVGAFEVEAARRLLALPEGVEPLAFTPLGYADDSPKRKLRKNLDSLVHWDRWQ